MKFVLALDWLFDWIDGDINYSPPVSDPLWNIFECSYLASRDRVLGEGRFGDYLPAFLEEQSDQWLGIWRKKMNERSKAITQGGQP